MPIYIGTDTKGNYYQWGNHGKRYYFKTKKTAETAKKKAIKQMVAAHYHGYQ